MCFKILLLPTDWTITDFQMMGILFVLSYAHVLIRK